MSEMIALTNLVIDAMKHLEWYGVSLWFLFQIGMFISMVVFPVLWFFLGHIGGSGE